MRRRSQITKGEQTFAEILLDAVDDGLGFLDEKGKQATYFQIEKRFDLKREEIPEKLEVLHNAIEGLFGYGAKVIEFWIAKELYERCRLEFEEQDGWTLKEYAEHAEKQCKSSRKVNALLKEILTIIFARSSSILTNLSSWMKPLSALGVVKIAAT